jgi:hypothetical protein
MLVLRRQVFKSGLPHRASPVMLPSYRGFLVRFADSGELEYGAEIAPVSCRCAGDRGFGLLDPFVFLRVLDLVRGWIARVLSLPRSWIVFGFCPTACAVGCVLSPLRGWVCRCASLPGALLCGSWLGLGFSLDGSCRGLAGGGPALHRVQLGGRIRGVRSGIGGRSLGLRAPSVARWPGNGRRRSGRFLRSSRRSAGLE